MKATIAGLGSLVLCAFFSSAALAQEQIPPQYQDAPVALPPPPPPPVQAAPLPPEGEAYAPALAVAYPYVGYVGGVPYPYLYAPRYGWSSYAAPWGAGRYRYGARFAYPGRGVGWRGGWGAHPHVGGRVGGGHIGVGHSHRR